MSDKIQVQILSEHVIQMAVPTPTLPPSFHTNSYVIRSGETALVVDAGTKDESVLLGLIDCLKNHGITEVRGVIATHYHRDHTWGLPTIATAFNAPIYVQQRDLEAAAQEMDLQPSVLCPLPAHMNLDGLEVLFHPIPGHTHGHVHILVPSDSVILVGDHLAGDGSVWIGPPDGHMNDYYSALDAIVDSGLAIAGPGHGQALSSARVAAMQLKQRRVDREQQIVDLLETPKTALDVVQILYKDTVPESAMWVARKTVQAHLLHLLQQRSIERIYVREEKVFRYHCNLEN